MISFGHDYIGLGKPFCCSDIPGNIRTEVVESFCLASNGLFITLYNSSYGHGPRRDPTQEERDHLTKCHHNGIVYFGIQNSKLSGNYRHYLTSYKWTIFFLMAQVESYFNSRTYMSSLHLFQAGFLYFPYYMWSHFALGKMKSLTRGCLEYIVEEERVKHVERWNI